MNAPIVPTAPDSTRPGPPAGLTATPAGATQVNLSWTAATDNVGVSGYRLERCEGSGCTSFVEVATPTGTTRVDTGLTPSTTYRYRVRAADLAGNLGDYTAVATVTTPAPPDTTAPSAPSGSLRRRTGSTGSISPGTRRPTTPASPNTGSSAARAPVARASSRSATTSTTSYSTTGLTAGTDYRFRVRAADAAGNLSAYSATAAERTRCRRHDRADGSALA